MLVFAFLAILLIALIFQISVTTVPLVIAVLVSFSVIIKRQDVFLAAALAGLALDILTFKTIGISSIFFVTLVFLIFSYSGKFEIHTLTFVFSSTFLASIVFLLFEKEASFLTLAFINCAVSVVLFQVFKGKTFDKGSL